MAHTHLTKTSSVLTYQNTHVCASQFCKATKDDFSLTLSAWSLDTFCSAFFNTSKTGKGSNDDDTRRIDWGLPSLTLQLVAFCDAAISKNCGTIQTSPSNPPFPGGMLPCLKTKRLYLEHFLEQTGAGFE